MLIDLSPLRKYRDFRLLFLGQIISFLGSMITCYMTGPLIGNARAGWLATATSTQLSITSGGILCVVGVVLCGLLLPGFWHYRSSSAEQPRSAET